MRFPFHKKEKLSYDRENLRPVISVSICTGEETAGFRDLHTGKFRAVQLIREPKDLREFMELYGLEEEPPREY